MAHEIEKHNGEERFPIEVSVDLPILTPQRLAIKAEQRRLFLEFVRSQMKEGIDYGRFGGAKKDTLLKAGAEKLCSLFGLGQKIVKEEDTIDRENQFSMCSRTISVYSLRTGVTLAEGQGSMNSMEPQHRKKHFLEVLNTLQKMAAKRAFVAAVISATNASEIFSQDLEDTEIEHPIVTQIAPPKDIPREIGERAIDALQKAREKVYQMVKKEGLSTEIMKQLLSERYQKESSTNLNLSELEDLAKFLERE